METIEIDKNKLYHQKYREAHREKKNKYNKEHYNKEYFKQWYINNKSRILETHVCNICNGKYTNTTTAKMIHLKSKKHNKKSNV